MENHVASEFPSFFFGCAGSSLLHIGVCGSLLAVASLVERGL